MQNLRLLLLILSVWSCTNQSYNHDGKTIDNSNQFINNNDSFNYYYTIDTSLIVYDQKINKTENKTLLDSAKKRLSNNRRDELGLNYLRILMKKNDYNAFAFYGKLILHEQDSFKGKLYLEKSVQMGSIEGIKYLAYYNLCNYNYDQAVHLYLDGYRKGDLFCGYVVAYLYIYGDFGSIGRPEIETERYVNKLNGEKLMKEVADKGYYESQYEMCLLLKNKNKELAFSYLVKAYKTILNENLDIGILVDIEELLSEEFSGMWTAYNRDNPNEFK